MTETCTYSFSVKAYLLLIGVSLSEPHTSELNDGFSMGLPHIYVFITTKDHHVGYIMIIAQVARDLWL